MRAFKTTFVVFVEPADAIYNGEREKDKPLTLEEVKSYLNMLFYLTGIERGKAIPLAFRACKCRSRYWKKSIED
jgi:hypothetical protein